MTTSGHEEKTTKKQQKTDRIHISFESKVSKKIFFTGNKEDMTIKGTRKAEACDKNKKNHGNDESEVVPDEAMDKWKAKGGSSSSSINSPQTQTEEMHEKTTFIVLQKNTRSMNSSERLQELFSEIHQVAWDVILISVTWHQGKEVWETQQGHIMVESGKFTNKHGVAILLNRRWKNHPDHQVEKTYKTILTTIEKDKGMKIMGAGFNAELGPGEGIELSAVGHYTLNKANCRGEWMTQWLLENSLVALNTMYKKLPQKQVTYHTPMNGEKQLDYILTDRKHYSWSRDAEANDTIHMGSDHRCVMAKFEIPKEKGKPRHTKAPTTEREGDTCEDEYEQRYRDLEQEVKEAEPGKSKKSTTKEATETKVEAMAQKADAEEAAARAASAASAASTAAADGQPITKSHAVASVGTVASEAQETKGKDERVLALKSVKSAKRSKSASETTQG